MSCYIPVIEKLKILKVNGSSSSSNGPDTFKLKSNVSKSKKCSAGSTSTSHLQHVNRQVSLQDSQIATQTQNHTWKSDTIEPFSNPGNGIQSNSRVPGDTYQLQRSDKAQRILGIDPQTNIMSTSSPIHLQQHHFSVPACPMPSPPPSYYSNDLNRPYHNPSQSLDKNIARSPPPPYGPSMSKLKDKDPNQSLRVLPLSSSSNNPAFSQSYQNDINLQNQYLPPRPPKHDGKRSQIRRRDPNGVTIVQQVGSFPNNVPLNIRHNHPTLGLSDVAYQRQHSDHGKYRAAFEERQNGSWKTSEITQEIHDRNGKEIEAPLQKGVLTLGLPSHWKKLPFKKPFDEDNNKLPVPSPSSISAFHYGDDSNRNANISNVQKEVNLRQSYQTASSNFIHHTYETLGKPSIFQSQNCSIADVDGKNMNDAVKHIPRNSSLPRRLRKCKTPTPNVTKSNRYRPRSAQDNLIINDRISDKGNMKNHQQNIYVNDFELVNRDKETTHAFDLARIQVTDASSNLKSGSDQDDDEGICEGDISTGSKSGGRNTTSSSGASSGGSRSPDDEDDSSRQLVHCVERDMNQIKNANRRYLHTMPAPHQGPPPRHLLPSKLKPSPAFKMHPIPLLSSNFQQLRSSQFANLRSENNQHLIEQSNEKSSSATYSNQPRNVYKGETLRIKGRHEYDASI